MSILKPGNKRPLIISGPCGAESEKQVIDTCTALADTGVVDILRVGVWKPRTFPGSFEGSGSKGLRWVARARELSGLPVAVEVASAKHVRKALKHGINMFWIGSRTTVSPFAVQEVANALRDAGDVTVFVKNPMNPDLAAWEGAVDRLLAAGIDSRNIGLIHRGFSYYGKGEYRNAPMWQIAFDMRRRFPQLPMLCDPSHIAGKRELLREVSQTAADLDYNGLMIESHIDPSAALSDADQQVTPDELKSFVGSIRWRLSGTGNPDIYRELEILRSEIDRIDMQLFELIASRMSVAEKIGQIKKQGEVAIFQKDRWSEIVDKVIVRAGELGLSREFTQTVLDAIHMESIGRQNKVMNR